MAISATLTGGAAPEAFSGGRAAALPAVSKGLVEEANSYAAKSTAGVKECRSQSPK